MCLARGGEGVRGLGLGCGGVYRKCVGGFEQGLDYLCRWQVQVSVYCARRISAHLRCTQCSILLHFIDISFLPCICLWHISQIQTCLCVVVGPGFVSTSPAFMSSTSHPAGPHGWLVQKNGKSDPLAHRIAQCSPLSLHTL